MRNHSTKAEIRLWCELLQNKQTGYSFLRQRSIADFFCKELKLIIEVDSPDHETKIEKDLARDSYLQSLGYATIRFSDDEVMFRIVKLN
jgi:very-short-patch-repair endonuclease